MPLIADVQDTAIAEAQAVLNEFPIQFDAAYQGGLRRKLGLFTVQDSDPALAQDLLDAMTENQADFTLTFRRLSDAADDAGRTGKCAGCSPIPPPMMPGRRDGGSGPAANRTRPPSDGR